MTRCDGHPSQTALISARQRSASISAFSEFVRGGAIAAGIASNEFEKLDLVLEEILINVARYAYTPETGIGGG